MSKRIATKCPACHNSTLVIGDGNWLACSLIGCPDPARINSIGDRADSHFDDLQTLRDERDRLASLLDDCWRVLFAKVNGLILVNGEVQEVYQKMLDYKAALTPAGGGQDE